MINSEGYVFCFCVLILAWPFLMLECPFLFWPKLILFLLALIANTCIFVMVVHFISGSRISFWKGLSILCEPYMSGCANITIIYIFFILLYYYIRMISIIWSINRRIEGNIWESPQGRDYIENWWEDFVQDRFNRHNSRR
jgi:hypothetical protein